MLHDLGLPFHLWAESCNTVVYLQNIGPHCIMRMSTLEEAFSGKKPNMAHFRIFGSSLYYHVTKDALKNIKPIAELGIFVGYTDIPHNYWVYLSSNKVIVVHRDVKFDEKKAITCSLEWELQLHVVEKLLVPKEEP